MFNMFYIDLYTCDFVQMSTVNKPYNTIHLANNNGQT